MAQLVKNSPAVGEVWVGSLGWEDPPEDGLATHSRILAWRIPMHREAWQAIVHGAAKSQTWLINKAQHSPEKLGFPDGASGKEAACQRRRPKRFRFNPWFGNIPWKRPWQPTPVFLPGESHGQRSLESCSPWVAKSRTRLKRLSTVEQLPMRTIWRWAEKIFRN